MWSPWNRLGVFSASFYSISPFENYAMKSEWFSSIGKEKGTREQVLESFLLFLLSTTCSVNCLTWFGWPYVCTFRCRLLKKVSMLMHETVHDMRNSSLPNATLRQLREVLQLLGSSWLRCLIGMTPALSDVGTYVKWGWNKSVWHRTTDEEDNYLSASISWHHRIIWN